MDDEGSEEYGYRVSLFSKSDCLYGGICNIRT